MALPNRMTVMSDGGGGSKTPATKTPTSTAGIPAPNKNAPVQKLTETGTPNSSRSGKVPDINNSGFNTDPVTDANFRGRNNGTTNPSGPSNLTNPANDAARRAAAAYQDEQNAILAATRGNPNAYGGTPTSTTPTSTTSTGGGGYGGGGGGTPAAPATPAAPTDAELLAQALNDADLGMEYNPYQLPDLPEATPERLEHVDTTDLRNMLQQIVDAQKTQSQNQIDRGVEQGVNELNRAMEDAAAQYQTQRDQATADEMRALDNQALYAEARGDRGGIGEAQYASIQAAAAQNRRAVNDAQVKLGTDTARQISDLRSQGEFEKADQLLTITQNYLSKLMGLEQWALEANMSVDEFNSQLQQWVDEYNLNAQKYLADLDLSAAQLTGAFANGNKTLAAQNQLRESLANSGSALLSAGVLPSKEQLEAMGMTAAQAKAYIARMAVV